MAKININNNSMALFMVYEAIVGEREEWKELEPDENGMYDLNIQLNGKELNVERFIENLQKSYQQAVKKKATDLLSYEYDKMLLEIHDIQQVLELHNRVFSNIVFGKKV